MILSNTPHIRLLLLAIAAVAAGACGPKENATTDSAGAVAGDTTGLAAQQSVAPAWTDANIFALLDEANVADSAHGQVASTKGTSAAVREFGRQMMRDHHTLRAEGEALAKRLNITPAPPAGDTLVAHAQRVSDLLNTTAKGKDFDKAYIDHEVEMHKGVLDIATKAMTAAQSTELKNMIQKAAPAIQGHLDKAQSIQRDMQ
jgi:putative membrane protein